MGATCSVLECPTDDDEQCAPSVLPLRSFGLTGDKLPVLGLGGVVICGDRFEDPTACKKYVLGQIRRGAPPPLGLGQLAGRRRRAA